LFHTEKTYVIFRKVYAKNKNKSGNWKGLALFLPHLRTE
jgi:hypothetical protein